MMIIYIYLFILHLFCVHFVYGITLEDKQELIVSFSDENQIRHIVIQNDNKNCFSMSKTFSKLSMFSACWEEKTIMMYSFINATSPGFKMLFLVDLKLLTKIFRPYLKIENAAYKDSLWVSHKRSLVTWLGFNEGNADLSKTLSVPYDTRVYVAETEAFNLYRIYETYLVNDVFFYKLWGSWSHQNGLSKCHDQARLLSGVSIKRQYLNDANYGPYNSILKPGQEVLDGISKTLNFSYNLLNASDVDFFNYDISDMLTVMVPYYVSSIIGPTTKIKMFVFLKGSNENLLSSYFMYPFDLSMWIALICWIILAMTVIAFVHYISGDTQIIFDNTASVFEAFCNQSGSWVDASLHSRIYRASIWLTVGLVLPSYTAVIFAFMTVRQVDIPFQDLHGLANDGRYRLGIQKGSAPLMFLKMDPSLSDDLDKVLVPESELPLEIVSAASLICKGHYAFIGYNDIIRALPNTCNIVNLKKPVMEIFAALLLTPYSPLSSPFTTELVKFWPNGMMNRFQRNIDYNTIPSENAAIFPVQFDLIRDVYTILSYGLAASFIIFIFEHFLCRFQKCIKIICK